jgi:glycosyltransferase involved in cell wall biosynthesis
MARNKKTILHIVEAMGGGVFTYLVDLSNQLCDQYNVYIAYATREQTPKNFQEYFDKRIKLIEVKGFTRSINPLKDLKAFFEIRKIAKNVSPDIIHLHSSKAGVLGRWAFNGKKASLFYTPHAYSFLMKDAGWAKRLVYKSIESMSGKRRCTTIACSKGEYEESLKLTKQATYINNGICISKLQEMLEKCNTNDADHPFTVFTLGRICYQKNPELFNKIAEKVPDVKFLWIGDGELRDKLTSSNIEITGWVNREKALEYSSQADAFILTSLWEGLPISLLEAMYIKKICIVSDVIGNRDVIQDGVNGFVCKDPEAFMQRLNELKFKLDQNIIENAYEDVLDEYNTKVMASKYKSIYESNSKGEYTNEILFDSRHCRNISR